MRVADELDAVRTAVHDGPQLVSEALHLFPHGGGGDGGGGGGGAWWWRW